MTDTVSTDDILGTGFVTVSNATLELNSQSTASAAVVCPVSVHHRPRVDHTASPVTPALV